MKDFIPIEEGQLVALDTVVVIYFLEKNARYYQLVKDMFYRIEQGNIRASMSSLVFAELLVPAYRKGHQTQAENIIRLFKHFPNLTIYPVLSKFRKKRQSCEQFTSYEHLTRFTPLPLFNARQSS